MAANVKVMGPRGAELDMHLHGYCLMAANFFAKKLKIDRFKTDVTIRMHHKFVTSAEGVEGQIMPLSERAFVIDVCLYGNWLGTLAHEMVHMKQYLRNDLDWGLTKWKGRSGYEDVDYWSQPWEKEARRLQNKMMVEFVEKDQP
jgi:hypothetical protein